jgi:hypothetical protein
MTKVRLVIALVLLIGARYAGRGLAQQPPVSAGSTPDQTGLPSAPAPAPLKMISPTPVPVVEERRVINPDFSPPVVVENSGVSAAGWPADEPLVGSLRSRRLSSQGSAGKLPHRIVYPDYPL